MNLAQKVVGRHAASCAGCRAKPGAALSLRPNLGIVTYDSVPASCASQYLRDADVRYFSTAMRRVVCNCNRFLLISYLLVIND
jgi:hypothetical protein